jgi:hypothetical protein
MEFPATIFCLTPDVSYPIVIERNVISGVGCKTVNVYFECDYAFYQSKGSNISTLTDYVIGFFNQVATLYANEDVAIQVSEIFAWTVPDPYVALTSPSAIMAAFRTNRGTNFNGHLAHFLTTRNVGGGIAYVNTVCNKAYAYGVSRIYTTYSNFPTYSWTVNVVAHELGHNLGSPHTHSCSWPGGPIDNCQPPEGTCSPGPAPIGGGTVMSYCHTVSAGINFNKGFGILPGNLIRSTVLNASCVAAGTLASPPSSLATNNITGTSATFTWAIAPSTSTYTVQYKPASSSTWTTSTTSTNSFNVSGLVAGTNYQWSVKSDCSPYAPAVNFTTGGGSSGCATPSSLSSSSVSQTGATLNWGAVTGATGYTVQYKTAASSTWISVNAATTSTALSGLTAATNYVWQVKANCSSYSAQQSFTTTSTTGCASPGQLASTNVTQTSATLSWGIVQGATSYTLQYKTSSASTWTSVSITTNSRSITGLIAGTGYVWQVKANCSVYSSQAAFTTLTSTTCPSPVQLSSTNITQTGVTLSWGAVTGALSYTVQYKTPAASTWTSLTATTNSRTLSGLTSGTNYVWQVKANCSVYSPQSSFTTAVSTGCSAPSQLATTNVTQTGATVSWGSVMGATGYTIQYKTSTASIWTTLTTTTTSRTLSGLTSGTNYMWQVKANCSAYSAQSSFTTASASSGCTAPTNLIASGITTSSATLTWTGPGNALNYSVRYRLVGASGWTFRNNISGTSTTITGLMGKRNYQFIVTAKCSNGITSPLSISKTFTTL